VEVTRRLGGSGEEGEGGGGGGGGGGFGGRNTYIYVVGVDVVRAGVSQQRVHPDPVAVI